MAALKHFKPPGSNDLEVRLARAERRVARERAARLEAEAIAEQGLRRLYESQQRLLLLQRITDGANRTTEIEEALRIAVTEICRHMDWAFGNALLVQDHGNTVVGCDVWHAADPVAMFPFVEASRCASFRTGVGLPGRILADVRPHWIDDVTSEANFPRRNIAADCGLAAACAFPVMVGEEAAGVLEFFARRLITPDDDLLGIMGQIGTQLGRVIERDRARRGLIHDALHDAMTRLPNRTFFMEQAGTAFDRMKAQRQTCVAVMVVDLDGFKAINDSLGHQAGDALLIDIAGRMQTCVTSAQQTAREGGEYWRATLARVGGDEFNVLVDEVDDPAAVIRLADRIHRCLAAPSVIAGTHVRCQASVGIAYSNPDYSDVEQMLRDADLAMYRAKSHGRGRSVTFTEQLGLEVRQRTQVEQELRQAIAERQFVLHYQPIVSLHDPDGICGFEALIRWNHPSRGLLLPVDFIDVAEDSGLILFIGDWVLQEACRQAAAWHWRTGGERLPFVSINISPQQFLQPEFVARVHAVLMETGITPAAVRLEVTEGVAIMDAARTSLILEEIRGWGVKTSLDDFGTGFSSLSYLQALPFDALKIDRSFVAAMDANGKSRRIVQAILDLAKTMNMTVIAEGIETAEQEELLQRMGCDMGQGFRYGRAENNADAFAKLALC
ncbi:putative bifunctional diguanylate cyclase/phosphodiesterase [Sphingomonas sp. RS2018]